jgi:hypothetical protein
MCQFFRREQISCTANHQQRFAIHRQQTADNFQQSSGSGQKIFLPASRHEEKYAARIYVD